MMTWMMLVAIACMMSLCLILSIKSYRRSLSVLVRCKSFWLLFITAMGFCMVLGYFVGGQHALKAYEAHKAQDVKVAEAIKQFGSKDAIVNRFHRYVLAHPGTAKPWFLLGKLYLSQGKVAKAHGAFLKAYQLKPDVLYGLYYAQSDQYQNQGSLSPLALEVVKDLYQRAPHAAPIMALEAQRQTQLKHDQQALALWQSLLGQLDPQAPLYQQVAAKIQALK